MAQVIRTLKRDPDIVRNDREYFTQNPDRSIRVRVLDADDRVHANGIDSDATHIIVCNGPQISYMSFKFNSGTLAELEALSDDALRVLFTSLQYTAVPVDV